MNHLLTPVISVVMITYNHDKFIEEAIYGVVKQQTKFCVELIIADDNSPDHTEEKVKSIINDNANLEIKYIKNVQNKGMITNFVCALKKSIGKYIALCEGDDYWTDPLKLQKQVDYLEKSDCFFVFHSVEILQDTVNGQILIPEKRAENRMYSIDELLLSKVAHTASFVFKNDDINFSLLKNEAVFGGDLVLALLLAERGKVYGFKDSMAVYRKHEGGITSIESKKLGIKHDERFVKQFIFIKREFKSLSKKSASIKIVDNCMTVFFYYYQERNLKALKFLFIAMINDPFLIIKGIRKILKDEKI